MLPEDWWCVVERIVARLDLVVEDHRTLIQRVPYQVLSHDDHGHAGAAHILLGPGEDQAVLHNKKGKTVSNIKAQSHF